MANKQLPLPSPLTIKLPPLSPATTIKLLPLSSATTMLDKQLPLPSPSTVKLPPLSPATTIKLPPLSSATNKTLPPAPNDSHDHTHQSLSLSFSKTTPVSIGPYLPTTLSISTNSTHPAITTAAPPSPPPLPPIPHSHFPPSPPPGKISVHPTHYCTTCHSKIATTLFASHCKAAQPNKPFPPMWAYADTSKDKSKNHLERKYRSWIRINSAACPFCDTAIKAGFLNPAYEVGREMRRKVKGMVESGVVVRMSGEERRVLEGEGEGRVNVYAS
ncbi:hypothetical protein MMC10_002348 [Thelotrema lepadinum]|nr:hypothetical protein [Thelotrema lepadinum]